MLRFQRAALFALIILGSTALAAAAHWALDEYRNTFEFGALVAIVALVGSAAYYVREQVREAQRQNRRARSLAVIDQLNQHSDVVRRLALFREVQRACENDPEAPWWDDPTHGERLRDDSNWLLGIFEDLSLTVRSGVADEVLLHDSLASIVPAYYELWLPFIQARREREDDLRLYTRFEQLATAWGAGKSLQTDDWLPTLFAPREWEELSRVRRRVIASRRWIVGTSIALVPMTLFWIAFRLVYCWDVSTCGPDSLTALCVLCRLDDVVRVGLLLVAGALVWLVFNLFILGATRHAPWWAFWRRVREGSRNLSGTWEPEKGSGPGLATVGLALVSVGIAFYLYFFGFETYFDVEDFPDAVVREFPLERVP